MRQNLAPLVNADENVLEAILIFGVKSMGLEPRNDHVVWIPRQRSKNTFFRHRDGFCCGSIILFLDNLRLEFKFFFLEHKLVALHDTSSSTVNCMIILHWFAKMSVLKFKNFVFLPILCLSPTCSCFAIIFIENSA